MQQAVSVALVPHVVMVLDCFSLVKTFLIDLSFIYRRVNTKDFTWSSRLEMFCEIGVLENFAKFTRKYLWWSLFFNKVAQVFSYEVLDILRTTLLQNTTGWLLLFCVGYTSDFVLFRTQSNIEHGAKTLFSENDPSQMFDRVLNTPLLISDKNFKILFWNSLSLRDRK